MSTDPELLAIEEEVEYRFQPINPLTRAIAEKLSRSIYKQRRYEQTIAIIRAVPPQRINALSSEDRVLLRTRVSALKEKIKLLKRAARNYSLALTSTESNLIPESLDAANEPIYKDK